MPITHDWAVSNYAGLNMLHTFPELGTASTPPTPPAPPAPSTPRVTTAAQVHSSRVPAASQPFKRKTRPRSFGEFIRKTEGKYL